MWRFEVYEMLRRLRVCRSRFCSEAEIILDTAFDSDIIRESKKGDHYSITSRTFSPAILTLLNTNALFCWVY